VALQFAKSGWGDSEASALFSTITSLNGSPGGGLKALSCLNLSQNSISDGGCRAFAEAALAGSSFSKLTEFLVAHNQIGDEGVAAFAKVLGAGVLPKLAFLNFNHNVIGNKGAASLADAINATRVSLKYIRLAENQIGDPGMKALEQAFLEGADCEECDVDDNPGDPAAVKAAVLRHKKVVSMGAPPKSAA